MWAYFIFKDKIDQWVHYESITQFPITFYPVILAATDDSWFDPFLKNQGLPNYEFLILFLIIILIFI